jgi:polysaccharide chain length determinant protein (PEP-CTERM system associated)
MSHVSKIQSPRDIIAILWRRKWQVIVPGFVLLVLAAFVTISWPRTYQSTATILIEEPNVSGDILGSAIDYRADEHVQVITQRVLSRVNLISLIEKLDLYPEARNQDEQSAAAASLRDSTKIDFISAEVSDPRMVRPGQTTIAFTLSFFNEDPQMAQTVVNELVSLYLAENSRSRQQRVSETKEFLAREADKRARQISELETELAAFKSQHTGSLPDQVSVNQQTLYRIELQLLELRHQIQAQEERKVYLKSKLSQVSPYASITLDDGSVLQPEERLTMLESEYSKLSYTYGPRHPTMVEIASEIETLKQAIGAGSSNRPSNPAYIQLQAELEAVNTNIGSLKARRGDLSNRFETLESQTLKAPDIEREFLLITRNYENATAEYRAVKEKLAEAERMESLETERKGERFSVIELPEVPLKPVAPRRRVLALVGFMIAVVGGLGTAAVAEALDQSVSGPRHLTAIAGSAPLVVIPYIETKADKRKSLGISFLILLGFAIVCAAALFAFDQFVTPLDELWASFSWGGDST